jgi:hypothetical protein
MDRRRDPRFPLEASVDFTWSSTGGQQQTAKGRTRNISLRGLFVFTDVFPAVGTVVMFNVTLPSLTEGLELVLRATGTVTRIESVESCEPPVGFAAATKKKVFKRPQRALAYRTDVS